ncbi:hypothetical protein MEQU1_000229 [Malassezia equina]|uniref:Uncharacterized protein n=1 Tax=Malassezia equina TaxID=1381935 RepID=A0AAF0IXB5_9BASI|nr:hypothetical protein MEQU1_000229 [Malassezia equina]
MPGCNEAAVRALFSEHGGDTLQAKDLIQIIDSYEQKCGTPVVAAPIALQMSAFASDNGALMVGVDEFLGMVRSLEQDADSSVDTSVPSLIDRTEDSPDTTLDMGPESPMKHKSAYASQARAQLDRTSAQGSLTSTQSDSDMEGVSVRSRLIRKLARVSDQLERLQNEHDCLSADKEQGDSERAALQRQVKALQRELHTVREHARHLEDQLHHLEETLTSVRRERNTQARTIKTLDARVSHLSHVQKEQEASAAQQEAELENAHASCHAHLLQVQELQATCHAQRQAMDQLDATVRALETVHMDTEKLQAQVDASRQVRERLEWELHELRQQTGESVSVLARDLDPLGEWAVTEAPADLDPFNNESVAVSDEAPRPRVDASESHPEPASETAPAPPSSKVNAAEPSTSDVVPDMLQSQPRASLPKTERWAERVVDLLLQKVSKAPSPPTATVHAGWVLLLHVLLVVVGMWLGVWLYHISLRLSPQYVYQQLLDRRWKELNLLHDSLHTPLSTQLWLERHLSTLA